MGYSKKKNQFKTIWWIYIFATIIITFIAFILYVTNYGSIYKSEFILQFRTSNTDDKKNEYNTSIKEYTKTSKLLNVESSGDNKSLKLSFDVVMKEDKSYDQFVTDLSSIKGITEVIVIAAKNDVDY